MNYEQARKLKSQIIIEPETKRILCSIHGKGKEHDFKLFKRSKVGMSKQIICLADKGYQGIQKKHDKSKIPHKKTKNKNYLQNRKKIIEI